MGVFTYDSALASRLNLGYTLTYWDGEYRELEYCIVSLGRLRVRDVKGIFGGFVGG